MKMLDQRGFTLVESIVVSVLSTVVGGALFSLLFMYTDRSSQSISSFCMQQQYENVARQIAKDVRRASFVLKEGETPNMYTFTTDTVDVIILWDASGNIFAQYKIDGNDLLEGSSWSQFNAGSGNVSVNGTSSFFVVSPHRKEVKIDLAVSSSSGETTYTMAPQKDVLVCRN